MNRAGGPFSLGALLALVLVGSGVFLLLLYAIGAGWTGDNQQSATERADSDALNGFSALATLLERRGHEVIITRGRRSQGAEGLDEWDEQLLILTPGLTTDPAELAEVIEERKYQGPTIVILPKWMVGPIGGEEADKHPDDWVRTAPAFAPQWFEQVPDFEPMELEQGATRGWRGLGMEGPLPDPQQVQAVTSSAKLILPLITDSEGDVLVGYWNRDGWHPELATAGDIGFTQDEEDAQDDEIYPLVLVAEPDLFNNFGMANQERARAAMAVIEASMGNAEMPIVFDMTIDGVGQGQNLLTLAFRPPFVAATLCLLAALVVIGWRAFRRFGPPLAEAPAMAHGKTQLASNGAALIQRARRWHLLGAPYAALVAGRIAAALQIRAGDEPAREAAIDAALDRKGHPGPRFTPSAQALRAARRLPDMLRAAGILRSIERTLCK
ncbi:MAG: DUF4350 domain-containing protein [Alteraurantiacibacter sp.]